MAGISNTDVYEGVEGPSRWREEHDECRECEKQGELVLQDIACFRERGEISDLAVASPGVLSTDSLVIGSE